MNETASTPPDAARPAPDAPEQSPAGPISPGHLSAGQISWGVELRDAFYALGLITLVVTILYLARSILTPIALAILLWFLVNAIANLLQGLPVFRYIMPSWLATTLAAAATVFAMYWTGQVVVQNFATLQQDFNVENFEARLDDVLSSVNAISGLQIQLSLSQILNSDEARAIAQGIFELFAEAAQSFALILLLVLFLLLDQPYYDAKIRALFPDPGRQRRVRKVLHKIGEDTRIYIWLMTLVSLIVGISTYAIAEFFGLPGAAFWGFLAFALNYIPTIGSFLGVLFPGVFALVQFDELERTVTFLAALGVVQFVSGNIVLPRLMGDRLNLSEFVVILSLSIWGPIWGVPGLFLAVPLMMVLAIVLSQFQSTRAVAILMSKTGVVMRR